ncbi:hypothetical protein PVA38_11375 [Streptococcus pneumoniae D39]|nr:hypothetical protein PVA38_11375 [Streptococcus pneumoniae D39]
MYKRQVLAIVSNSYPPLPGRLPTRYSPIRNSSREASSSFSVLLACIRPVSYTHLRAHETVLDLVCRLLLEKKKT